MEDDGWEERERKEEEEDEKRRATASIICCGRAISRCWAALRLGKLASQRARMAGVCLLSVYFGWG